MSGKFWTRGRRHVAMALTGALAVLASQLGVGLVPQLGPATVLAGPAPSLWTLQSSGTTSYLAAVTFGNGAFVAVGNGGTILTSLDGSTWSSASIPTTVNLTCVTYGGGVFVAAGYNSTTGTPEVLTSPNGSSWSEAASPALPLVLLHSVAYGGGRFVAVGASGTILTSADGTAWTSASSSTTADLYGVAYGGGEFVAVGARGTVVASLDGSAWTSESSGTTSRLIGVGYGAGRFVAAGVHAWIATASGAAWSAGTSDAVDSFMYAVAYGDGQFVAVGAESGVSGGGYTTSFTSADGDSWSPGPYGVTSASPSSAPALTGVAFGNNLFVAVAGDGRVWSAAAPLTSGAAPLPPAPQVTGVTPSQGPARGGTEVTVTGAHFAGVTVAGIRYQGAGTVSFGTTDVGFTVVSDTEIQTFAPAGTGTVDITVTGVGGTSATVAADRFTYVAAPPAPPQVTGVSPPTGPTGGGVAITVSGSGLSGATAVTLSPETFGAGQNGIGCNTVPVQTNQIISANDTGLVFTLPPLADPDATLCSEDVLVTTPQGTTAAGWSDLFMYIAATSAAPVVGSVNPAQAPASGGAVVTIQGGGFTGASAVSFGGWPAPFKVDSDTTITATVPPASQTAGTVDVTVTSRQATSATGPADHFTYDTSGEQYVPGWGWGVPPVVQTVNPYMVSPAGGAQVTVTGSGFTGGGTMDVSLMQCSVGSAGVQEVHEPLTVLGGASSTSFAFDAPPDYAGLDAWYVQATTPWGASARCVTRGAATGPNLLYTFPCVLDPPTKLNSNWDPPQDDANFSWTPPQCVDQHARSLVAGYDMLFSTDPTLKSHLLGWAFNPFNDTEQPLLGTAGGADQPGIPLSGGGPFWSTDANGLAPGTYFWEVQVEYMEPGGGFVLSGPWVKGPALIVPPPAGGGGGGNGGSGGGSGATPSGCPAVPPTGQSTAQQPADQWEAAYDAILQHESATLTSGRCSAPVMPTAWCNNGVYVVSPLTVNSSKSTAGEVKCKDETPGATAVTWNFGDGTPGAVQTGASATYQYKTPYGTTSQQCGGSASFPCDDGLPTDALTISEALSLPKGQSASWEHTILVARPEKVVTDLDGYWVTPGDAPGPQSCPVTSQPTLHDGVNLGIYCYDITFLIGNAGLTASEVSPAAVDIVVTPHGVPSAICLAYRICDGVSYDTCLEGFCVPPLPGDLLPQTTLGPSNTAWFGFPMWSSWSWDDAEQSWVLTDESPWCSANAIDVKVKYSSTAPSPPKVQADWPPSSETYTFYPQDSPAGMEACGVPQDPPDPPSLLDEVSPTVAGPVVLPPTSVPLLPHVGPLGGPSTCPALNLAAGVSPSAPPWWPRPLAASLSCQGASALSAAAGPRFGDLGGYGWAGESIDALAAHGVIQGVSLTTFDPAAPVTRAQFGALVQRLFSLPAVSASPPFGDVHAADWYYGAVRAAAPYMGGTGPATFDPGGAATREDVAATIVRLLVARGAIQLLSSTQVPSQLAGVTDAAAIAPYLRAYVATAMRYRILLGFPDGSFQPQGVLTRAQAAVLLYRVQQFDLKAPTGR